MVLMEVLVVYYSVVVLWKAWLLDVAVQAVHWSSVEAPVLQVASVVAVALLRALPFPRPGRALIHQLVLVDVVIVDVEEVPAGCAVAPMTTRPAVMVVVEDLPAVAAGSVSVVRRVQVPVVPALVAECTHPNPHRPGHTECH